MSKIWSFNLYDTLLNLPDGNNKSVGLQNITIINDGLISQGEENSPESNIVQFEIYRKLAVPSLNDITNNILRWNSQDNVTSYTIFVDSAAAQTGISGSATSFDLSTLHLNVGSHIVQLRAVGSGYRLDSDLSSSKTYEVQPQLAQVTNVSISGSEVTFDEVEHATSYEFFVDGTSIGTYNVPSAVGYTLNYTANSAGDPQRIYYKTSSDSSGTSYVEINYGQSTTISNCTYFKIGSESSGAELNSLNGTIFPSVEIGSNLTIDTWYSVRSNVTIDITAWI